MNIGKKLYLSFGIILATVLVLLAINPDRSATRT